MNLPYIFDGHDEVFLKCCYATNGLCSRESRASEV